MNLKHKVALGIAGVGVAAALYLSRPDTIPAGHRIVISTDGHMSVHVFPLRSVSLTGSTYGVSPDSILDEDGDGRVDRILVTDSQEESGYNLNLSLSKVKLFDSALFFEKRNKYVIISNKRDEYPELFRKADKELHRMIKLIEGRPADIIDSELSIWVGHDSLKDYSYD
ncbi:hypothetical protein HYZ97_04985 [Candidatus Pacearchaeota archaeon]|nr:hypothetical protein [Candidatus Pacearchaeota archaeon]